MPRLDFYTDYKLFAKVKLGRDSILVGRGGDCDVQLPHRRVSRHHARIEPGQDGSHVIENLCGHGTRVNAAMVEERTRLSPGDRIYIEDYVLIYQPDDAPAESLAEEETVMVPTRAPAVPGLAAHQP